jgi:hypothetical protein
VLGIPVAIVTDADPRVERGASWEEDRPTEDGAGFEVSSRTQRLIEGFRDHSNVAVFCAEVTLEYDLAKAGPANAAAMAAVWEGGFTGMPQTFNAVRVEQAGNDVSARALVAWRGICRADPAGSKADFAHRLAAYLDEEDEAGASAHAFDVPMYIRRAVEYVVQRVSPPADTGEIPGDQGT